MKDLNIDPRQTEPIISETIIPSVSKPNSNLPIVLLVGGVFFFGAFLFNSLEARRKEMYAPAFKSVSNNVQNAQPQQFDLFIPDATLENQGENSPPSWDIQPIPKENYSIEEPKPTKIVQMQIPQPMPIMPMPQPLPPPQNAYNNPLNFTPNQPVPSNIARNSSDPALIYDRAQGSPNNIPNKSPDPNSTDNISLSGGAAIRASYLPNKTTIITQGTLIPAVLETAIDSTRAGIIRAIVTRDVKGFDGKKVLIQRGSQLIGEYRADMAPGQKRAFVIWTRLIRPDAVSIALASPSSDKMGNAGISGKVDTHFLERFGSAFLNSVFQIGSSLISRNNDTSIIIATSGFGQTLNPQSNGNSQIQPTLRVKQGAIINVMVAKDLDFTGIGDDKR